jgi:hypothetical protein
LGRAASADRRPLTARAGRAHRRRRAGDPLRGLGLRDDGDPPAVDPTDRASFTARASQRASLEAPASCPRVAGRATAPRTGERSSPGGSDLAVTRLPSLVPRGASRSLAPPVPVGGGRPRFSHRHSTVTSVQRTSSAVRASRDGCRALRATGNAAHRASGSIAAGQRALRNAAATATAVQGGRGSPVRTCTTLRVRRCGTARSGPGSRCDRERPVGGSAVHISGPGSDDLLSPAACCPSTTIRRTAHGPRGAACAIAAASVHRDQGCPAGGLSSQPPGAAGARRLSRSRRRSTWNSPAAATGTPQSGGPGGNPGPLDPALSPAQSRSMITRRAGSRPWLRLATPS